MLAMGFHVNTVLSCKPASGSLMLPNICPTLQSQMGLPCAFAFSLMASPSFLLQALEAVPPISLHCDRILLPSARGRRGGQDGAGTSRGICPTQRGLRLRPPSSTLPIRPPQIPLSEEPVIRPNCFAQMDMTEDKTTEKGQSGWNESASMTTVKEDLGTRKMMCRVAGKLVPCGLNSACRNGFSWACTAFKFSLNLLFTWTYHEISSASVFFPLKSELATLGPYSQKATASPSPVTAAL